MSKKISQLNAITTIQEDDLIAVVEGSETKKAEVYQLENYLIPTAITMSAGSTVSQSRSIINLFVLSAAEGKFNVAVPVAPDQVNLISIDLS